MNDFASDRRSEDYYAIHADILEDRFESLRSKFNDVLRPDETGLSPSDKEAERDLLGYAALCRHKVLPTNQGSDFTRWKGGQAKWPFKREHAFRLLNMLWDRTYWSPDEWRLRRSAKDPNAYYYALVHRTQSERATKSNLQQRAPGLYQLWRRSIIDPDQYVLGLFGVYVEEDVMKTIELHRLPARRDKDGIIEQPMLEDVYFGYMVKKSRHIMIHAFEVTTRAFQYSLVTNQLRGGTAQQGTFQMLSGIVTGLVGHGELHKPMVCLRHGDLELPDAEVADGPNAAAKGRRDKEPASEINLSPDYTATDRQAYRALRSSPVYDRLRLVPQAEVPPFVLQQLRKAERG